MNFAAFDLNLLRVFDALMRERSVTKAGEQIGLSQPAVSNALNRLRQILDDQLFIRHGSDMLPTPRAESLAEPIRAALAGVEQALSADARFNPASAERTFTLVGSDMWSTLLMPPLADRIAAEAPGISLRYLDSAAGDLQQLLRDDVIDAALAPARDMPDWVSRQLLFPSNYVIVAAPKHRAIRAAGIKPGQTLPLDLFCALPHAIRSNDGSMRGYVDDALQKAGRTRRVVLALPHFHAVALAVARGQVIAALPAEFAKAVVDDLGLAVFKPPVDVIVAQLHMYWHKRHDQNQMHRWLRDHVVDVARKL